MHILFLSDNFPPEVNAPASRTYEHAREWVRAGHLVTVITCAPNFPSGRLFKGYRNRLFQRETMDGIDVVRLWTYMAANTGFAKRCVDYASFMTSAIPASLAIDDVDVVVATSPQLFAACAGAAIGALKRRPFVFELRDLWPASIKAVGAMRNRRVIQMLERVELGLYQRADHIVSVTQSFTDDLARRGVPREKMSVVRNGADLARFGTCPKDHDLASELNLNGMFVAGYVGTHGMAHALATLLEAAHILERDPRMQHVRLVFLGDGAEKAGLKSAAHCLNLRNVLFLDTVPRDEVARYWSLLDISIIHLRRAPLFRSVIPSKLFECMAMGVPVLHGVEGESAEIVLREGVGVTFEPENAAALADHITACALDPERLARWRSNALAAAPAYDRKVSARAMLNTLERVASARAKASAARGLQSTGRA